MSDSMTPTPAPLREAADEPNPLSATSVTRRLALLTRRVEKWRRRYQFVLDQLHGHKKSLDKVRAENATLTARLAELEGALRDIHAVANVSGDMGNPHSAIAKIESRARAVLGGET